MEAYLGWIIPLGIVITYFGIRFLKKKSHFDHVGDLSIEFEKTQDDANNKAVELLKIEEDQLNVDVVEDAIGLFDEAINKNNTEAIVYLNKALALYFIHKKNEALKEVHNALSVDSTNSHAYNFLGVILFDLGEYEQALAAYEKAIDADNKITHAYVNKANTLEYFGNKIDALELYDKAIEIDAENRAAYLNKAITLSHMKRHEESRVDFEIAMRIEQKDSQDDISDNSKKINSQDELDAFTRYFYKTHDVQRVTSAMEFVDRKSEVPEENLHAAVIGFFGEIFRSNQDLIDEWLDKINQMSNRGKKLFAEAMWQAGCDKAKQHLFGIPESRHKDWRATAPKTPCEDDIEWAGFLATGESVFVSNIIKAATKYSERNDYGLFLCAAAAKWSLASNAQQHEIVYRTLLNDIEKYEGNDREIVKDIIEKSQKKAGPEKIMKESEKIVDSQRKLGFWSEVPQFS